MESPDPLHPFSQGKCRFRRAEENSGSEFTHVIRQPEETEAAWVFAERSGSRTSAESKIFAHAAGTQHDTARFTFPLLFKQQPNIRDALTEESWLEDFDEFELSARNFSDELQSRLYCFL